MHRIIISWIVFTIILFNGSAQDYETEFLYRSQIIIDYLADYYTQNPPGYQGSNPTDFGKYNYPKIIAWFEKYDETADTGYTSILNDRMAVFSTKPTFHFNLVGLPRILYLYPHAPGVINNEKEFLRRVFERTDSYNAWTCEGYGKLATWNINGDTVDLGKNWGGYHGLI